MKATVMVKSKSGRSHEVEPRQTFRLIDLFQTPVEVKQVAEMSKAWRRLFESLDPEPFSLANMVKDIDFEFLKIELPNFVIVPSPLKVVDMLVKEEDARTDIAEDQKIELKHDANNFKADFVKIDSDPKTRLAPDVLWLINQALFLGHASSASPEEIETLKRKIEHEKQSSAALVSVAKRRDNAETTWKPHAKKLAIEWRATSNEERISQDDFANGLLPVRWTPR